MKRPERSKNGAVRHGASRSSGPGVAKMIDVLTVGPYHILP